MLRTNLKMHRQILLVACLLIIQACELIVSQTPSPDGAESPGYLQQAGEAYRAVKAKAHVIGETVLEFAGAYYEDHIKPVADPYVDWASASTSSIWNRFKDKMHEYSPI